MKKTKISLENYLERIPVHPDRILWSTDKEGIVTLEIENKGIMNRIAQKLFRKPKITYIHLDEQGSFAWQQVNGEKPISDMGPAVKERFGEAAEPLYPRLAKFFQILDSYQFIEWKK